MLFSEKAGRLFERSEFLPAPKKVHARGKPKAKLHGHVSFRSFLCAKEKDTEKHGRKINF